MVLSKDFFGAGIYQRMNPIGYVDWYLTDEKTGKITDYGHNENIVVNGARTAIANAILGNSVNFPDYIGVGTGTNTPAAGDTGLQTVYQYNGTNDAKQVSTKFIVSTYKARFGCQFITTEANTTIREIGLFDAADAGTLWARVAVNITKTSASRLTVFWHIQFDRDTDVALKTGTSIAATGTLTSGTDSTLTFSSNVTVVRVENNTSGVVYLKLNGAMSGTPPTGYDYLLPSGSSMQLMNEEIEISTIHAYKVSAGNITLPNNEFVAVGW